MIDDLKLSLTRNPAVLMREFAGATFLTVALVAGLSLPGLF